MTLHLYIYKRESLAHFVTYTHTPDAQMQSNTHARTLQHGKLSMYTLRRTKTLY